MSDIEAARAELVAAGVDASEVFHCAQGYGCRYPGHDGRVAGRAPDGGTYGSFVTFGDPDGNGWILQEVTTRFPGRVAGDTTYTSASDLAQALRRAAAAHGEHEARTGEADANWPDWYAEYMVREQTGQEPPRDDVRLTDTRRPSPCVPTSSRAGSSRTTPCPTTPAPSARSASCRATTR